MHRLIYRLRWYVWPNVQPWWPLALALAIGGAIWWDRSDDARRERDRKRALDRAFAAQINEQRAHAFLMKTQRRADSLEKRVLSDSASAAQWHAIALDAAKMIERQHALTRQLFDSLQEHPPRTLRDSATAARRESDVLRRENAELHVEQDVLRSENRALQMAFTAAREQVQLFRAAADSVLATLGEAGQTIGDLKTQLARSEPRCTSGIPLVPCLSRKASVAVGAIAVALVVSR